MSTVTMGLPYLDRWYFAALLDGASERLAESGHSVRTRVHAPTGSARAETAGEIAADLAEPGVIGAIVAGFRFDHDQARAALAHGKPLVSVGGAQLGFPTVMIDDIGAARHATEHLLRLGHRRIAHLAGTIETQMDFAVHGRRLKGYTVAMASAGLETVVRPVPFDPDEARRATAELLGGPLPPTAVFAVSDEIALAALDAVRDAGLEPGHDVSVIGFDDHPSAAAAGLTTIRQDPHALGATAATLLLQRIEEGGDGDQGSRLLPTSLIERESTARPAGVRSVR